MKWFLSVLLASTAALANSGAKETFSQRAWHAVTPIYEAIYRHPFNQEFLKGTLPAPIFAFYEVQDQLYLRDFVRSLATLAERTSSPDEKKIVQQLIKLSEGENENAWRDTKENAVMSPANLFYTSFLLRTAAYHSRAELAAALLPCFWIYQRLAADLKPTVILPNSQAKWLADYRSNEYRAGTQLMIDLVDQMARSASPAEQARMLEAFTTAARLEWYFWDSAYHQERWQP